MLVPWKISVSAALALREPHERDDRIIDQTRSRREPGRAIGPADGERERTIMPSRLPLPMDACCAGCAALALGAVPLVHERAGRDT